MNLIMITPRVGFQNELLAFIPGWLVHLARYTDQLWVITPRAEDISLPENVSVYEVGRDYSQRQTILHAMVNFHRTILDLLRNQPIDGVFAHMYPKFAILAWPYTRIHKLPLLLWYTHTSVSWQLRIAAALVDRIITATPGTCNLHNRKILPLGHGIDIEQFHFNQQTSSGKEKLNRLISIGRISPSKNYEVILEALDILIHKKDCQDFQLTIIGGIVNESARSYFDRLKEIVKNRHLTEYVEFIGEIPHQEVLRYLHQADYFISASDTGLDKAVLEAMACGVIPVVSLEVFQQSLGNHSQLLMYKTKDPSSLAEKLSELFNLDNDQRHSIRLAMRNVVVNHHNVELLMRNIVHVFEEVNSE